MNFFGNNQHIKEEFPQEKELKKKVEELERENEELKRQLKEKADTQNAFPISQQLQHMHQFKFNDSESNQSFEKIEDIKIGDDNKYVKVMMQKICVLKEKMKLETNSANLVNELEIMNYLNHPNVLKAECETVNNQNHQPSILVEYCSSNLERAVKEGSLSKVQQVFSIYQIAEGMKYIHSHRIIHNNLKPSSIQLTSNGKIKIGDFENSRIIKSDHPSKEEQIEQMADISSFGNIVYFILSGGKTAEIKNSSALSTLSLLAQQLIDACWWVELESRPSFEIICEILEKNDFNLASLSQQEIKEVSQMISQYKKQLFF